MSSEVVPDSSLVIEIPETSQPEEPPKKKTSRSKSKAKPEETVVSSDQSNENTTTEPKPKAKPVRMQTKTVLKKPLVDEILRITKQYVSEMEQKLMELEHQ